MSASRSGSESAVDQCCVKTLSPTSHQMGGGAGLKDGLNIKVALKSFTEHIFCIVLTEYIFVLIFPIKCKLPRSGLWVDSFQRS